MQSTSSFSNLSPSKPISTDVFTWGKTHYRQHIFKKDEVIPTRPGLLYFVERGAIRMVGKAQINDNHQKLLCYNTLPISEEVFLGFVGESQPFEIISQFPITLQAIAHLDETSVIWLYWNDLDNWGNLREEVLNSFRYQHQRKLLWLSMLGQKRTIDRLLGFISLLVEQYGQMTENGYYLPYALTHAQIASAIGTTRVTVTRLMGRLRRQGLIAIEEDNLIYLPKNINQ